MNDVGGFSQRNLGCFQGISSFFRISFKDGTPVLPQSSCQARPGNRQASAHPIPAWRAVQKISKN
jgi:hypothetical protein